MDLLLTFAEDFLFTWVWTDEILAEWEEVIVREGRRTPESAASVTGAVRTYFGDDRIDPATYRHAITDDLSPDPDDRVHAAAAIHGNADVVLTRNLKHLRTEPVMAAGIEVITSDEFLCALLDDHPGAVIESFMRAAAGRQSPRHRRSLHSTSQPPGPQNSPKGSRPCSPTDVLTRSRRQRGACAAGTGLRPFV
jgi:predicted nucleic acid-binding protein